MAESLATALRQSVDEPAAFETFYRGNARQLLAKMIRGVYDVDTALDLTSETFARAFIHAQRFRGNTDAEAAAWLHAIGSKQLALYFRRNKIERRALRRLGLEPIRLDDEEIERVLDLAGVADLRTAVRAELSQLSMAQREVLQLRIVDELDYPEVARRLGISEEAARARVARGLGGLRKLLNVYAIQEES